MLFWLGYFGNSKFKMTRPGEANTCSQLASRRRWAGGLSCCQGPSKSLRFRGQVAPRLLTPVTRRKRCGLLGSGHNSQGNFSPATVQGGAHMHGCALWDSHESFFRKTNSDDKR